MVRSRRLYPPPAIRRLPAPASTPAPDHDQAPGLRLPRMPPPRQPMRPRPHHTTPPRRPDLRMQPRPPLPPPPPRQTSPRLDTPTTPPRHPHLDHPQQPHLHHTANRLPRLGSSGSVPRHSSASPALPPGSRRHPAARPALVGTGVSGRPPVRAARSRTCQPPQPRRMSRPSRSQRVRVPIVTVPRPVRGPGSQPPRHGARPVEGSGSAGSGTPRTAPP